MSDRAAAIDAYRTRLLTCTKCKPLGLACSPRHSTGGRVQTQLVVVAQNPPSDPERSLNGAYQLHYPEPTGVHEQLVWDLLSAYDRKTIYASQVMKCATVNNSDPKPWELTNCKPWFVEESQWWDDAPVLVFGALARRVVRSTFALWHAPKVRTYQSASQVYRVEVQGRFVFAPHPSCVTRFIDRTWWMESINHALVITERHPLILKHQDHKRPFSLPTSCPLTEGCVGKLDWYAGHINGYYCPTCKQAGQMWQLHDQWIFNSFAGDLLDYVVPF